MAYMTTAATHTTARLSASYSSYRGPEHPQAVYFRGPDFATREEAEAWAALFPKAAKLHVTSCTHYGDIDDALDRWVTHSADVEIRLLANDANGGVNETGLRRYRTILRAADKAGVALEWTGPYANSYPTRDAFEAAAFASKEQ